MTQIHATCIAIGGKGVLLCGPSGSGKSDLALRLVDRGAELVADDRVDLEASVGELIASAPENIKGLMEVRGVGIVDQPVPSGVAVSLVVDLVVPDEVERIPEPKVTTLCEIEVPLVRLTPFEASAAAKIRVALAHLTQ